MNFSKDMILRDAIEYVKLKPSNFLKLRSEMRGNYDSVIEIVDNCPMVIPYVITSFIKKSLSGDGLRIDQIIVLSERAVVKDPSVFPLIPSSFVTEDMVKTITEVMRKKSVYSFWVSHIPLSLRDAAFMEEMAADHRELLTSNDPYWKTKEGEHIKKKLGFKKRSNSLRKIISSGSFFAKKEAPT